MNKNNKRVYLVPQLTAVSFKSERGFAASGPSTVTFLYLFDGASGEQVESYSTHSGWGDDANNSFF